MSDAVIRVEAEVRDRLATLADARGMSIAGLLQEFAESTLTEEERREAFARRQQDRAAGS
ncbi:MULTISPECIES: hypothetical protein [Streptomyces]|uniref:hypothetical protein n=1 Tax=Streptomyces TaxID=1883 RepID=UPI00240D76B8|nr:MULTISPECIES: hypothetical protein [Streptomyces]WFB83636.1 hypothetical protein MMU79_10090 [Streptomyces olivaceus]WGK45940.1 hypothetical protein M6G09_10120 [Streptomyces sp. B146]